MVAISRMAARRTTGVGTIVLASVACGCGHDWDAYERVPSGSAVAVSSSATGSGGGGGAGGGPGGTVAVDAATVGQTGVAPVATLSLPHTTGGEDRLLLVGISLRATAGQTVTNATYGGTALELVGAATNAGNVRVEVWKLYAPATGTEDVVVTTSAAVRFVVGAVSLTGVDEDEPLGAFVANDDSSAKTTATVSDLSGGEVVVDAIGRASNAGTTKAAAGQEELWSVSTTTGLDADNIWGAGSARSIGAAGESGEMSWTYNTTYAWAVGAVAVKPR
jgi:hypothetical protein